jgi:hypothetical protein
MEEVITSLFPEVVLKKVDKAVSRGLFKSRSEALKKITEEYLKEHPELFIDVKIRELIANAPDFTDEELEQLGAGLLKGVSIAQLVTEAREFRQTL